MSSIYHNMINLVLSIEIRGLPSDLVDIAVLKSSAICCGVRGRALASHTGVRSLNSRGEDCLLLFDDY